MYFLLEIIASYFYPATDYAWIIKYLSVIAIFFTFLYDSEIDKESCIKAFYIGSIVLCIVIILTTFKNAPSNWLYLFSRGWFRFGSKQAENVDGMMLSVNANTLAYYSVVGCALAFNFIPESKGRTRFIHIGALALFAVSGVFTVSISWMLVMSVCTLLFVFTQTKSGKAVLLTGVGIVFVIMIARIALSRTPGTISCLYEQIDNSRFGIR